MLEFTAALPSPLCAGLRLYVVDSEDAHECQLPRGGLRWRHSRVRYGGAGRRHQIAVSKGSSDVYRVFLGIVITFFLFFAMYKNES